MFAPCFVPTLLVPAEGRQGLTHCFPLLHTPPGCLFSSCCCSSYPPDGHVYKDISSEAILATYSHTYVAENVVYISLKDDNSWLKDEIKREKVG